MARQSDYLNSLVYRKLDENGDYMIGMQGEILTGLQAIAQAIRTRLRSVRGEWFQGDPTALPYFNGIIGQKNVSKEQLDLQVIARIMDTIGVLSVSDIVSTYQSEKVIYVTQDNSEFFVLDSGRLNVDNLAYSIDPSMLSKAQYRLVYDFRCNVQTVYGTTSVEVIR